MRIGLALAASLAIHTALIGLVGKTNQASFVRPPGRQVIFRLVPRQGDAPKAETAVVKAEMARQDRPVPSVKIPAEKVQQIAPPARVESKPRKAAATKAPAAKVAPPVQAPKPTRVEIASSGGGAEATATEPGPAVDESEGPAVIMARPLYLQNPPPAYPEKARRRNLQGTVVLEVRVTAEGRVAHLQVKESSGHGILDKAALAAVQQWVFEPGRRNGSPVAMAVLVPVRFALQEERGKR